MNLIRFIVISTIIFLGFANIQAQEILLEDILRTGKFYFYKDSVYTGKAVEYFEKTLIRERNFKKGMPHGSEFQWYPSGRLKEEKNYVNGLKVGDVKTWYENGNIKSITVYEKGLKVKFDKWYNTGKKAQVVNIKTENNKANGTLGMTGDN